MSRSTIKITEIFYSLQGETTLQGLPTVFIRLTGCPLRCQYCDTEYAFYGGEDRELSDILEEVAKFNPCFVTVTGGEPLAQKACLELLTLLCNNDYTVSLETSGALDISRVDSRVIRIVDIKTPGSGESLKNRYANIEILSSTDQVKFVICNKQDYEWAKAMIDEHQLPEKCEVLFLPSHHQVKIKELAEWVLNDRLNVRVQMQMHKLIWGDLPGK
ncbi:MAG: 7-carboxy-7-deazaguanine synthase QueE [Gammaproteobacteria bacterium]